MLLHSGAFDWTTAFDFDSNGGAAVVTGFGIDDGQPDLNKDGFSDASGVQKAPKFAGLDTGLQHVDIGGIEHPCVDLFFDEVCFGYYGAEITGSFSTKIGIEYGFYSTDSTVSIINAGNFGYNVTEPTNGTSPFVIDTANTLTNSNLFTTQAQVSMYADVVISVSVHLRAQGALIEKFPAIPIDFDIDNKIPLVSFNRQVRDDDGSFVFNADGTPQFDGKMRVLGLDPFLFFGKDQGAPLAAQIFSANVKTRKAERDLAKAKIAAEQADTNSEKKAANKAVEEAQTKLTDAKAKAKQLSDREANGSTGAQAIGELITLSIEQGTGDLIGLSMEVGVGAGISTGIPGINPSVNLEVGSVSATMPRINLTDSQADENGNLYASTFAFPAGSRQDIDRTVLNLSVHPTAFLGLGTYNASLFPLAAKLTTVDDKISTSLKVNQTVSASHQPDKAIFDFTDKVTGKPVSVSYSVDGAATQSGTSATFVAGQKISIPQFPGIDQLVVTPHLQQSYDFSNTLGLDLSMINYFKAFAFELGILGENIIDVGPLYERTDPIFDKDLGAFRNSRFTIDSPDIALSSFDLVQTKADLQVELQQGPPSNIFVTPEDPNPLLSYTVVVTNNGVNDASGVNVVNFVPPQLKFDAVKSSAGITVANGVATFPVGDLKTGESKTVTFAGSYIKGGGTSISNWIIARGSEFDPVPNNNKLNTNTNLTLPLVLEVKNEAELRAAVDQVNNSIAVVPPVIYLKNSSFTLTQGEIAIKKSVIITSESVTKVLIDAQNQSRHFVLGGDGAQVYRFESVSLTRGNGSGVDTGLGGAILMIDEDDTLSMENSSINASSVSTGEKLGGGIFQRGGSINLKDVRVVSNRASAGAGLYLENTTASFDNAIVLTNEATTQGGGLEAVSTSNGSSKITIARSDFEDNQSPLGANIHNLANSGSALIFLDSSTFGTTPAATGEAAPPNFSNETAAGATATITSLGNNISSDDAAELTADSDLSDTTPGMHASSLEIASGQAGYVIGKLSMNWPNIVGKVNYDVSDDDNFLVVGDVLMLRPSRKFNLSSTKLVPLSIVANDETNQTVGRNTNFLFHVVEVNLAPTKVEVTYVNAEGVPEHQSVPNGNGLLVGTVQATDPNNQDVLEYAVDDARFQVIVDAGIPKLYLKPSQELEAEEASTVPLKITVTDPGGMSFTDATVVQVKNIREAPTEIAVGNGYVPANLKGALIGPVKTLGPEGISDSFSYTVDDARFEIIADSEGKNILKLVADQSLPNSKNPIAIKVTAVDSEGLSVTQEFELTARTPVKPTSSLSPLPSRTSLTSIPLAWKGSSKISGELRYNIYVSTDGSAFEPYLVSSTDTSTNFTAELGHKYSFSSQVVDSQGNAEKLNSTINSVSTITTLAPFQNPLNKHDVENDGKVTPIDALLIINKLNDASFSKNLGPSKARLNDPFLDVNGDSQLSPTDALLVINSLYQSSAAGEGESSRDLIFGEWSGELVDEQLKFQWSPEIQKRRNHLEPSSEIL